MAVSTRVEHLPCIWYDKAMEEQVRKILQNAHDARVTPGAVVGWIKHGEWHVITSGRLTYDPRSPEVTADTVYDIASITKSIPLASLVHMAIEEGRLQLDTKAALLLPALKGKYHDLITIKHLLTYTAIWDMPHGLSQFAAQGPDSVMQAIYELPLVAKPGEKYCYTNAPALVLGKILETLYDAPLDHIASQKLFAPLGMTRTRFDASTYTEQEVAPTEQNDGKDIHKIVHDETARTLRENGLVSGNAGVFSTIGDLLKYCEMILQGGITRSGAQLLSPTTIELFEHNYLGSIGETAALGWELNQPRFMGTYSHAGMFGKTGFTGCVVLIDRTKQAAMVLLTNAQYPKRHGDKNAVNALRRALADVVFSTK